MEEHVTAPTHTGNHSFGLLGDTSPKLNMNN